MVKTKLSETLVHGPAGSSDVMVNITVPEALSAAEGVYVGVNDVILLNVPVPLVVHVTDVTPPLMVPANGYVLPEQMVAFEPAVTTPAGLIVNVIELVAATHGPAGSLDVIVKLTVPAAISAALGVYTADKDVLLLNVPLPLVVHVTEVAPPLIEPERVYTSPEQMVAFEPAFTCASEVIVNTTLSETAVHGPAGSLLVIVNVTVPAAISTALGMYIGVNDVLLLNVPVPLVVHVTELALPPMVPAKVYVLPEHTVAPAPAVTVGI
jgi:hypothetical protein